jgi:NAD(P)-dependent dehydrogenase (short-subunit alcohol dehydrogenase family)
MSEIRFDGDVALITGAGRGIGRSHALELARRGARVVVNDAGGAVDGSAGDGRSPADAVAAEIRAAGGRAVANHDSVATPEGGAAIVAQAIGEFGRIDIVINNAGILRDKKFHHLTPELLGPVLDVHLAAPLDPALISPVVASSRAGRTLAPGRSCPPAAGMSRPSCSWLPAGSPTLP